MLFCQNSLNGLRQRLLERSGRRWPWPGCGRKPASEVVEFWMYLTATTNKMFQWAGHGYERKEGIKDNAKALAWVIQREGLAFYRDGNIIELAYLVNRGKSRAWLWLCNSKIYYNRLCLKLGSLFHFWTFLKKFWHIIATFIHTGICICVYIFIHWHRMGNGNGLTDGWHALLSSFLELVQGFTTNHPKMGLCGLFVAKGNQDPVGWQETFTSPLKNSIRGLDHI